MHHLTHENNRFYKDYYTFLITSKMSFEASPQYPIEFLKKIII